MTPEFDPEVVSYTATTANATNKITAVAEDEDATVEILVGETEIESGESATWETGENTVKITVTNGDVEKVYTVVVTKSE